MSSTESEVNFESETDSEANSTVAETAINVLRYLGSELTQHPERVAIQETQESATRIKLTLLVDKADMGRVIGRHGKIASAIRAVVRAAGAKDGVETSIEITERV